MFMNRREFIRLAAALAMAPALSCNSVDMVRRGSLVAPADFTLEETIGANELLIDFPDKIKGAKRIDKYMTPGARKVVVNIRQSHYIEDASETELRQIKIVHDNIYHILLYLIEKNKVKGIYHEGVCAEILPVVRLSAWISHIEDNPSGVAINPEQTLQSIEDVMKLKKANPEFYQAHLLLKKIAPYDAVYRLASERKAEILPAEETKSQKNFHRLYEKCKSSVFWNAYLELSGRLTAACEEREDSFLRIASCSDDPLVVMVYGLMHAWGGRKSFGKTYRMAGKGSIKDNIAAWNPMNNGNKYSLIEIVPCGL